MQTKVFSPYDMRNEDNLGHEAGKDSIYAVKKVARSNKETEAGLIHLCRMDSSISSIWTGPFPIEKVSG